MKFWIMVALMLIACDEPIRDPSEPDQCLRRELFAQCMAALPKGPEHVHNSNDWDEVVDSCGSQAYYQSLRRRSKIKEECRP